MGDLDLGSLSENKSFNNILKVHIFNSFSDTFNIVKCGLNAWEFFDEYAAIEEAMNNNIAFSDTGNCYIHFYDKNMISFIVDQFETFISREFLSDSKIVRILNISGNIGKTKNEIDRYSYIYLLNRLCNSFININIKYETKINLDIPDFKSRKDYNLLCREGLVPKDILNCGQVIKSKLLPKEHVIVPTQIEFGSGFSPSPYGYLKKGNRLIYVDPVFSKSRNIMNICIQIKSKINDLLNLFLQFPTNSKTITRLISSRTMQCMTMEENIEFLNLISKICINEFMMIVPDYKMIIKDSEKEFGNINHHVLNSVVFGFDTWNIGPKNRCVWTKNMVKSFLEKMKNLYLKNYDLNGNYDVFPVEIDGKGWYLRGELSLE